MFTLTHQAHEAVRQISCSGTTAEVPGLRISRRSDRPTFAVRRAAAAASCGVRTSDGMS